MSDPLDALYKELDRRSRAERRLFIRQQIADAKRVARALKAAGVPVRSATIAGTVYEFNNRIGQCHVSAKEPGFGLEQDAAAPPSGSSKTEACKLALDSALATARKLKSASRPISPRNTSRNGANVFALKSRSRT
jgi:hypothetical protein